MSEPMKEELSKENLLVTIERLKAKLSAYEEALLRQFAEGGLEDRLAIARKHGREVISVGLNYGQLQQVELDYAQQQCARRALLPCLHAGYSTHGGLPRVTYGGYRTTYDWSSDVKRDEGGCRGARLARRAA